jgi:hypothetical protein
VGKNARELKQKRKGCGKWKSKKNSTKINSAQAHFRGKNWLKYISTFFKLILQL